MDMLYSNQFSLIEYPELDLDGCDGPYLSVQNNSIHFLEVDKRGDIIMEIVDRNSPSFSCFVDNEDEDAFDFEINHKNSFPIKTSKFEMTSRVIVISDIEGNFNALYSLLLTNHVMTEDFKWSFNDGQLVILGDLMDKGRNVTPCLWLIYHLENEARANGGQVHFILGNHELMNITLDVRYVHEKYLALAQKVSRIDNPSLAYWHLLKRNNVLFNWIKGKNCMEQIGDFLFVHAGVSPEMFERKLSIERANETLRQFISDDATATEHTEFLIDKNGPLWYRGLVVDHGDYEKITERMVDDILDFYGVQKMVIGHTVVENISSDYHGKILRTDVLHPDMKLTEASQALLIEDTKLYCVNGRGTRRKILRE